MDARNLLDEVIAKEVALEWEREKKRIVEDSLWDDKMALQQKVQERSKLMADKEGMLADIEIKGKLIDDFMVFIGAVENNDLEKAQKFDEKAMMEAVATMIKRHGNHGSNRKGSGGVFGAGGNNELEISQIPVEQSMVVAEAIKGTKTDGGTCSSAGGNSGN